MKKNKNRLINGIILICFISLYIQNEYLWKYITNKDKVVADNSTSNDFTVMSYNIRCWTFLDIGKKSWYYRANLILSNIKNVNPHLIGFQEVTSIQYNYLKYKLKDYGSIIEYRDNAPWSEGCPIFYNLNRYELLKSDTFWLSETPEKISKDWGAANYRICSYVVLLEKLSNTRISVFNTHLDHKSEKARIQEINVLLNRINSLEDMPIILMGDFNAEESTETYLILAENFKDTKYYCLESKGKNTYQDWGKKLMKSPIDYIMVSQNDFFARKYYILNQLYNGEYPSDHFPVCVEFNRVSY